MGSTCSSLVLLAGPVTGYWCLFGMPSFTRHGTYCTAQFYFLQHLLWASFTIYTGCWGLVLLGDSNCRGLEYSLECPVLLFASIAWA